jgi:hypothetical protein
MFNLNLSVTWGESPIPPAERDSGQHLAPTVSPDPDPDTNPDPVPEMATPPRGKKLSTRLGTPAAACTAAKAPMAVAASAAGRDPVAAAAAVTTTATTTGTIPASTTAVAVSDR